MKPRQHVTQLLLGVAGMIASQGSVHAHPHVWTTYRTTVLFDQGRVVGFRHAWTFDEMYTAMAVAGLDRDGDGAYSREELAELAQINVESLKEFAYFTFAKLGTQGLVLSPPKDYWLEYANERLSLHFTLQLADPVLADAPELSFSVVDETFFIAFDMAKEDAIALGKGAPSGCVVSVGVPQEELDQLQQLNAAFAGAMTAGDANIGMGVSYAQTISLRCPGR